MSSAVHYGGELDAVHIWSQFIERKIAYFLQTMNLIHERIGNNVESHCNHDFDTS